MQRKCSHLEMHCRKSAHRTVRAFPSRVEISFPVSVSPCNVALNFFQSAEDDAFMLPVYSLSSKIWHVTCTNALCGVHLRCIIACIYAHARVWHENSRHFPLPVEPIRRKCKSTFHPETPTESRIHLLLVPVKLFSSRDLRLVTTIVLIYSKYFFKQSFHTIFCIYSTLRFISKLCI